MTIIVCLGPTPDTWWQAKNWIGRQVLDRAQQLAPDEDARKAIFMGQVVQTLDLYEMDSPLRERVSATVEEAARQRLRSRRPPTQTPGRATGPST